MIKLGTQSPAFLFWLLLKQSSFCATRKNPPKGAVWHLTQDKRRQQQTTTTTKTSGARYRIVLDPRCCVCPSRDISIVEYTPIYSEKQLVRYVAVSRVALE